MFFKNAIGAFYPKSTPGVGVGTIITGGTPTLTGPISVSGTTPIIENIGTRQVVTFDSTSNPTDFSIGLGCNATGGGGYRYFHRVSGSMSRIQRINTDGSLDGFLPYQGSPAFGTPLIFSNDNGVYTLKQGSTVLYTGTLDVTGTYIRIRNDEFGFFQTPITGVYYGSIA